MPIGIGIGGNRQPHHYVDVPYAVESKPFPYPGATLDLDFVNGQYYVAGVGIVSTIAAAGITFTRSTVAWYFNVAGLYVQAAINEPVREYAAGACLGLRIDESRTNFCTSSTDQTGWTKSECSASGAFTAPDGATGTIFLASGNAAVHRVLKGSLAGCPSGNTTVSYGCFIYVPNGSDVTRVFLRCRTTSSNGQTVVIRISGSGASASLSFSNSSPFGANPPASITASSVFIENFGNGLFRVTATSPASNNATAISQIDVSFSVSATEATAGTSNTLLGIWGLSIVSGAGPTSFIPTTTTAVTRAAAVAAMTGVAFSAWASSEMTLITKYNLRYLVSADRTAISLNDGTAGNVIEQRGQNTSTQTAVNVTAGSAVQAALAQTIASARNTLVSAIKANDFAAAANGNPILLDTAGSVPAVTRMDIGAQAGGQYLNGYIERIIAIPGRQSNKTIVAGSR